jgi:hypothetical protein
VHERTRLEIIAVSAMRREGLQRISPSCRAFTLLTSAAKNLYVLSRQLKAPREAAELLFYVGTAEE